MPTALVALLDALQARHASLRAEASSLALALGDSDASPAFCAVFAAAADAMRFHIDREERFFFVGVRQLAQGEGADIAALRSMVSTLEEEHLELLALQQRLVRMLPESGVLTPRVVAFLDASEAHHRSEDEFLFPRVRDLLKQDAGAVWR